MTNFWKENGKWRIGRFILLSIFLVFLSCFLYIYHQTVLHQLYLEDQLKQEFKLEKEDYQIKGQFWKFSYAYDIILEDEPKTSYLFNVKKKDGKYTAAYWGHGFLDSSNDGSPKHLEFERMRYD
ncbi:hypothetical protein [Exiguobacterium undae]|uniref:DUF3139 domain-containing protein n=1 Tax=Exiguobacterium undae TaxID=169177 RepID=A0ABX2VBK8_9BACL|nr:hypothetical protein [Exiguobacterium undae]OAN15618.1 hypothetical protein A3783_06685 [Exiguobacterium undae]